MCGREEAAGGAERVRAGGCVRACVRACACLRVCAGACVLVRARLCVRACACVLVRVRLQPDAAQRLMRDGEALQQLEADGGEVGRGGGGPLERHAAREVGARGERGIGEGALGALALEGVAEREGAALGAVSAGLLVGLGCLRKPKQLHSHCESFFQELDRVGFA